MAPRSAWGHCCLSPRGDGASRPAGQDCLPFPRAPSSPDGGHSIPCWLPPPNSAPHWLPPPPQHRDPAGSPAPWGGGLGLRAVALGRLGGAGAAFAAPQTVPHPPTHTHTQPEPRTGSHVYTSADAHMHTCAHSHPLLLSPPPRLAHTHTVTREHTRRHVCRLVRMCALSHCSSVPCAERVYTQSYVCCVTCAECVQHHACAAPHVQSAMCAQAHVHSHTRARDCVCQLSRHHTHIPPTHTCTRCPMCTIKGAQTIARVPEPCAHMVTHARVTWALLSCAHAASLRASLAHVPCPSGTTVAQPHAGLW